METNGVYFGAEIVRDLTPAPGSRMEKRRQRGREGGVGRAGRGSLHLWLPLSCFLSPTPLSVPLCPSVSAFFLLWPSISIPTPPMSICSLLGRAIGSPCFGTQAAS